MYRGSWCKEKVEISDHTENFELEDNSSLAKWSSLDLLAEEEEATSPTAPEPKQGKSIILSGGNAIYSSDFYKHFFFHTKIIYQNNE